MRLEGNSISIFVTLFGTKRAKWELRSSRICDGMVQIVMNNSCTNIYKSITLFEMITGLILSYMSESILAFGITFTHLRPTGVSFY